MITMNYEEYSKLEGLTASRIADFFEWDENTPPVKDQTDYFSFGNRYEECIRMRFDKDYKETFSIMPEGPKTPDNWLELLDSIKSGTPIGNLYVHGKKGLDGRFKNRHWWLDVIKEGKIDVNKPMIQAEDQKAIDIMVDKLMGVYVEDLNDYVGNLLKDAWWSVPIQWECSGIKKKALVDCIIKLPATVIRDRVLVHIDFKSSGAGFIFNNMWKRRYRFQERHYTEGIESFAMSLKDQYFTWNKMLFFVGNKDEPYLPYVAKLEDGYEDIATKNYEDIVIKAADWIKNGCQQKGHLPTKNMKAWRDNE